MTSKTIYVFEPGQEWPESLTESWDGSDPREWVEAQIRRAGAKAYNIGEEGVSSVVRADFQVIDNDGDLVRQGMVLVDFAA